tara:strand:+ start:2389 stop:3663 length:1275 start_codon:yes stop_codon:yes gene_type:complete
MFKVNKQRQIVTAIDVGTTKICTIIAERIEDGNILILGHGTVSSVGALSKAIVENVDLASSAIISSVHEAQNMAGIPAQNVYVGVTGAHIEFENRLDNLDLSDEITNQDNVITTENIASVPTQISQDLDYKNRQILHALPMSYQVDETSDIVTPVGMHTGNLAVKSHVVTIAPEPAQKLQTALNLAGINDFQLVLEPMASARSVLTRKEMREGVILADIGGGTTDIIEIKGRRLRYTAAIPVAGQQFTNDIVQIHNTNYESAEKAKLEVGTTNIEGIKLSETVDMPVTGRDGVTQKIQRISICKLLQERAEDLALLIKLKIREMGYEDPNEASLVLTGGASNLDGLTHIVSSLATSKVRLGVPTELINIPEEFVHPSKATSLGILLWASDSFETITTLEKSFIQKMANLYFYKINQFLKILKIK